MERSYSPYIIMALVMLSLLGMGFFYVGRKIYLFLLIVLPGVEPRLFIIIPLVIALSFVLSFLPVGLVLKKALIWLNWLFMGSFFYFLLLFGLSDLVLFLGRITGIIPAPTLEYVSVAAGGVVIALVALIAAYGVYEGKQIRHTSYEVSFDKETAFDSLRIVMLADIHLGYQNDEKWLEKLVKNINSQEPDVVVIAGDVFNDNFHALSGHDRAAAALRGIKAEYGVYAVFGNHDAGATYDLMRNFLAEGNVTLLQDEHVTVQDKLVLVGRCDPSPIGRGAPARKPTATVMEGVDASLPVIVIEHQLGSLDDYVGIADLVFAGHTHKGQVFPGSLITRAMYEVDYGHYRRGGASLQAIVTSGAGVWGPSMRIGTKNEIVSVQVSHRLP